MALPLFKRKDPVCGMKEEKGKGLEQDGEWFCSKTCLKKYSSKEEHGCSSQKSSSCCGHCH